MRRHVVIQRPPMTPTRSGRELVLMPGPAIDREVLIEAPAEVVWRTITGPTNR